MTVVRKQGSGDGGRVGGRGRGGVECVGEGGGVMAAAAAAAGRRAAVTGWQSGEAGDTKGAALVSTSLSGPRNSKHEMRASFISWKGGDGHA